MNRPNRREAQWPKSSAEELSLAVLVTVVGLTGVGRDKVAECVGRMVARRRGAKPHQAVGPGEVATDLGEVVLPRS